MSAQHARRRAVRQVAVAERSMRRRTSRSSPRSSGRPSCPSSARNSLPTVRRLPGVEGSLEGRPEARSTRAHNAPARHSTPFPVNPASPATRPVATSSRIAQRSADLLRSGACRPIRIDGQQAHTAQALLAAVEGAAQHVLQCDDGLLGGHGAPPTERTGDVLSVNHGVHQWTAPPQAPAESTRRLLTVARSAPRGNSGSRDRAPSAPSSGSSCLAPG